MRTLAERLNRTIPTPHLASMDSKQAFDFVSAKAIESGIQIDVTYVSQTQFECKTRMNYWYGDQWLSVLLMLEGGTIKVKLTDVSGLDLNKLILQRKITCYMTPLTAPIEGMDKPQDLLTTAQRFDEAGTGIHRRDLASELVKLVRSVESTAYAFGKFLRSLTRA